MTMGNLTIRMDADEKKRLNAWAASKGKSVTEYLKDLIDNDMAAGSPESRARAWLEEEKDAIATEADAIRKGGIPGSHLALHHPKFDDEV
jgi:plasmid stability protein